MATDIKLENLTFDLFYVENKYVCLEVLTLNELWQFSRSQVVVALQNYV